MNSFSFTLVSFFIVGLIIFLYCSKYSMFSLAALSSRKVSLRDRTLLVIGGILIFIGVWSLAHMTRPIGITRIPSPFDTLRAAYELLISGTLYYETQVSVVRIFIGFGLSAVLGIAAGVLAGSFLLVHRLTVPINSFLRYIPPTAFVSIMIVYFGIGETYKYAVVFVGVIFFIFQMTVDVVEDVDVKYLELGLTSGLSQIEVFRFVILPACWPRIVDVIRINLSGAWTFLVAAEIVGADSGLGHLIAISQRFLRIEQLYVAILMFGLIGIITDWIIQFLSKKVFPWHSIQVSR